MTYISHFDEVIAAIEDEAQKKIEESAQALVQQLKENLSNSGSGRIGYLPTGGTYQMSRPGEFPALATGALRDSVDYYLDGDSAIVGTPDIIGLYLELGTSKMRPRPWFNRTVDQMKPKIQIILREDWKV